MDHIDYHLKAIIGAKAENQLIELLFLDTF